MHKDEDVQVLKTEPSGESFLKLHVISERTGIFLCLKRLSKRATQSTAPDLFDQARLSLETSSHGTMRFVKEYNLIKRREAIGQSYRSLRSASRLCQLLVSNASHMPESAVLFDLVGRSLDAFAAGKAPEVVQLKSLYLILKEEGLPVRESWWPTLRADLRAPAQRILNETSPSQLSPESREFCEAIERQLVLWMRHHTDWIVPE